MSVDWLLVVTSFTFKNENSERACNAVTGACHAHALIIQHYTILFLIQALISNEYYKLNV